MIVAAYVYLKLIISNTKVHDTSKDITKINYRINRYIHIISQQIATYL